MASFFFFQAEDGIRDYKVTGVQTCALPISRRRLGQRGGDRIEAARQRMHAAGGQRDALGEAADAGCPAALADAARVALSAFTAAVGRLARDRAADEAFRHAAADRAHHARVLVPEHERRRPREQSLGRVDVRAADAGRVHSDGDLARPCDWLGDLVDRELGTSAPGRDVHLRVSLIVPSTVALHLSLVVSKPDLTTRGGELGLFGLSAELSYTHSASMTVPDGS